MKRKRDTPRRRSAPRYDGPDWTLANDALQRRSGGRCECCGTPLRGRAERHHRKRRRDGGDRLSNLMLLLPEHHAYWTTHPAEAIDRGVIVPTWADPSEVKVWLLGKCWARLDDDGSFVRIQATMHRQDHRADVPDGAVLLRRGGGYQAECDCGWKAGDGCLTRTDNDMALAHHLSSVHGLVSCS